MHSHDWGCPAAYLFRNNVGFTLLETILALSLSAMIVGLSFKLYLLHFKDLTQVSEQLSIQENTEMTLTALKNEIKQAGYIGCAKLSEGFPVFSNTAYTISRNNQLVFTDHSLISRHADLSHNTVLANMETRDAVISENNVLFKPGEVLIISDCQKAEIFTVDHLSAHRDYQIITPVQPFHFLFNRNAEISQLVINYLFVNQDHLILENIAHRQFKIAEWIHVIHFDLSQPWITVTLQIGKQAPYTTRETNVIF